tara:strand:- start:4292 stop:4786 length:495 start_codon:yes stop_codon:yes gene_type:complete
MAKRHTHTCPIAGVLNIFGDNWTWLVIREAFYGATRFSEIQRNTGIAKNVLSDRLDVLVNEGILAREDVGENGTRYAYRLTEKGESLHPVLLALHQWGNEHVYGPGNEPVLLLERATGKPLQPFAPTSRDGRRLTRADILARPGPGASKATVRRLAEAEPPASG